MRKQCRICWLKHLSSTEPSSSYTFLFGWFVSCTPASLDIVVALARDDSSLSGCQSSLKEILCDTNGSMAVTLQGLEWEIVIKESTTLVVLLVN